MSKKITLSCEVCKHKNYRVSKTQDERMQIKKFCKNCVKHTMHKEEK